MTEKRRSLFETLEAPCPGWVLRKLKRESPDYTL